jgi:Bacterial aa3 type cytochrome c oxidase subunit IV
VTPLPLPRRGIYANSGRESFQEMRDMADHGELEYATADGNDYAEHEGTYTMFITLTKWMVGFLVILLLAMAYFLV